MPKITIAADPDWYAIAALGGPVLDPLILRSGDLFLRGAGGVTDQNDAWQFLASNIHALGTFFDRLVIDPQVPVFDYTTSFESGLTFEAGMLGQVNANEEILVEVNVENEQHERTRRAALEELKKLYLGGGGIDATEAYNVLGELRASGYEWSPELDDLVLANENEKLLARYLLGGLVFGAYAQRAGADHLMQPKRSRMFLSLAFGRAVERRFEDSLFEKFAELSPRKTEQVPYTPSLFPYILSKSQGPREALNMVFELRGSSEIADYRKWLNGALADFQTNGMISASYRRDVASIAAAVTKKLEQGNVPRTEVKTLVTDIAAGDATKAAKGVGATAAGMLWGFFVDALPGRRHRKLLTRALVADAEFVAIENRVRTVWSGPGFGG